MIGLLSINHSVKTKDKKTPGRRGEWTESSGHFYGRLRAVQGIRGLSYTGGYGRFRGEWVKKSILARVCWYFSRTNKLVLIIWPFSRFSYKVKNVPERRIHQWGTERGSRILPSKDWADIPSLCPITARHFTHMTMATLTRRTGDEGELQELVPARAYVRFARIDYVWYVTCPTREWFTDIDAAKV